MRVSTKGDYGVRALIELAHHYGQGPLQSAEIAVRQSVPEPYLDQILTTLRRAGFIRSVRGPQGGHQLAKHPSTIRLCEVMQTLEGSLSPVAAGVEGGTACQRAQREIWERVHKATADILHDITIEELAQRERQLASGPRYFI